MSNSHLVWLCFSILHLPTAKIIYQRKRLWPILWCKKFSFVKATLLWEAILTLRAVIYLYYPIAIYFSEPGKWGQRELILIYWSPNKLKRNKQHEYTYFFTYRKHAVWKLPWTYMKFCFSTRAPNWDTWVTNGALGVEEKASSGC